jgi:mRNA interferase RelE/StbE
MRPVQITKESEKFLKKLEPKHAKQIALRIKGLAAQDHAHDTKPLKGILHDYFRIDVGDFRIIYRYDEEYLYITLIGKRNDNEVYNSMIRKLDS